MLHGTNLGRRRLCAALLLAALLLIHSATAFSVTAPGSVQEGAPIDVSLTGLGTLTITMNGNIVASGTGTIHHALATNSSSAGLYAYEFSATDGNQTDLIEVSDVPLAITILSPTVTETATNTVLFSLSSNWAPELCWVTIDGNSNTLDATSTTTFEKTLTVADGVHALEFKCTLLGETATVSRSLLVDTTPPTVTGTSPSGEITGPFITLTVTTDEIAQCKYDTNDGPYAALRNTFGSTYALQNAVTIESNSQGAHTYFVKCQDVHANTMDTAGVISFTNRVAPTADIEVEGDEPYKAGTYELTLDTNVPLSSTPTLRYTLQESGATHEIGVTGKNDHWKGYLIIPEDTPDTVIRFTFSGTSKQGITGTDITEGALLEVDAVSSDTIESITIENTSNALTLDWFVNDPDEDTTYNIYRADHSGVEYVDFYATTGGTTFTDYDAAGARYYYYRVAPVDKAGNIGALSAEVLGSVIAEQLADPFLEAQLQETITLVETTILDVEAAIDTLEQETNQFSVQVINDMGFVPQARGARTELAALKTQLESTPQLPDEVTKAIAHAKTVLYEARAQVAARISLNTQTETKQLTDTENLQRQLPYITAENHEAYLASATTLQEHMTVTLLAHSFSFYDLNNVEHARTFVRKTIKLDEPTNDVTLIEVVPEIAADVTFRSEPAQTDPIRYSFPVLEETSYVYTYDEVVPLEVIKESRTLAYPEITAQELPLVTGNVVSEFTLPSSDTMLIVIAILVILGLVIYYVSLAAPQQEFTGYPIEVAPRPVPRKRTRRVVRTSRTPRVTDPKTLLTTAEKQIDNKHYDKALSAYKSCLAQCSNEAHTALEEDITRVYKKLMLFKKLTDAGNAIEKKDVPHVRTALADAKELAKELGEQQTTLITDAQATFTEFVQALNKLEIERMADY
ncbi:MAG: hypothetical protein OXR66_05090 [Candidatus Woesearchaeota archaeon]|nr:hypothetical protein [Candidatus Woesearchaeota archaeon]